LAGQRIEDKIDAWLTGNFLHHRLDAIHELLMIKAHLGSNWSLRSIEMLGLTVAVEAHAGKLKACQLLLKHLLPNGKHLLHALQLSQGSRVLLGLINVKIWRSENLFRESIKLLARSDTVLIWERRSNGSVWDTIDRAGLVLISIP
jgi:hypothetical protein